MITKRTVFVLGAGASAPYGFPLGAQLYREILSTFSEAGPGRVHLFNTTAFTAVPTNVFLSALRFSGATSVDAFLENRPEFIDIGKACMAISLIQKEAPTRLWQEGDNWLVYLFSRMRTSFADFGKNAVSFLTFNYDRSLEYFLTISLVNTFGKSLEECAELLKQIPIIHLHGKLGDLPGESRLSRGYDQAVTAQAVEVSVRSMKIVHEEVDETRDKDFQRAIALLNEAQCIYLVGFGFGQQNIERLKLRELGSGRCDASGIGITNFEAHQIQKNLGNAVNIHTGHDALGFMRNVALLS